MADTARAWQVTVGEYVETIPVKTTIRKGAGTKPNWYVDWEYGGKKGVEEVASKAAAKIKAMALGAKPQDEHYELVKQAVVAGLPVPPEVLADYPDL